MTSKQAHDECPEECSNCGTGLAKLRRCEDYGPGPIVEWLCPYCMNAFDKKQHMTICNLMNVLESRIKAALIKGDK